MTARLITTMTGVLDAIRARRDELNLSHEAIDALCGFPSGYTSKLLAPVPIRGVSHVSLTAIMGALAMALVAVEDPGQRQIIEGRWQPRKRPRSGKLPGALLADQSRQIVPSTNGGTDVQATFEFPADGRTC
jgi:hypothetical protein